MCVGGGSCLEEEAVGHVDHLDGLAPRRLPTSPPPTLTPRPPTPTTYRVWRKRAPSRRSAPSRAWDGMQRAFAAHSRRARTRGGCCPERICNKPLQLLCAHLYSSFAEMSINMYTINFLQLLHPHLYSSKHS